MSTPCTINEHANQPIRFLCLEETCTADRLICHYCVRDRHRKHSLANLQKYIQPLARLGMNSQVHQKDRYCERLESAVHSITESWERISELVGEQSKFITRRIIHPLETIAHTFTDELVEKASYNMSAGHSSHEEVEDYVKMVNFLGGRNFNDPPKLMSILTVAQKNIEQIFLQLNKRLSNTFIDFQNKLNKYSFFNPEIESITENPPKPHRQKPIPQENKRKNIDHLIKNQHQPIIVPHIPLPINPEFTEIQLSQDPIVKTETEDSSVPIPMEIHIGLQSEDGINEMSVESRAKVRRVVVTCCKSVEAQVGKILSLAGLEELQIYWFQLGKKEYLIKIINHLQNLKVLVLNCANEFDEECSRIVHKKLPKIRRLEYGWDFYRSLRQYDHNIYFRLSPYTNRGCPLKTSVTREMVVALKRLENVWLGDFMYFRPSNHEIPFRNIKEFTLGQTKGKYFRIPEKLCAQLRDMRQLLSLAILHIKIEETKLSQILLSNPFLKTFVVEGCDEITDCSLKTIAEKCNLSHLSIRQNRVIEGVPIWSMANLTTLILVECNKIKHSQLLLGIPKMRFLTYLNLYGNRWVNDELVSRLPNVENFLTLNLGRTSITDHSLQYLALMKQLKVLCIDCNRISGVAIANLARHIKNIEKISLWGLDGGLDAGFIADQDLEVLAQELSSLTHLSIRYCKQLKGSTFLSFKSVRFIEADREILGREVQEQLQRRGVKLLLDLQKIVVQDEA